MDGWTVGVKWSDYLNKVHLLMDKVTGFLCRNKAANLNVDQVVVKHNFEQRGDDFGEN